MDKPQALFEKVGNIYRKLCRVCRGAQHKAWTGLNKEKVAAGLKKWNDAHKDELIEYHKKYRETNKEKLRLSCKNKPLAQRIKHNAARALKNRLNPEATAAAQKANYEKHRTKRIASMRAYAIDNPEIVENIKAARRVRTAVAAIPWHKELTDFVVQEAANLRRLRNVTTGISWHVDHVIPLKGKLVTGFHVYNNLAVIPEAANRFKKNKHNPNKETPCWSF
jgi:hypothetical protein